MDESNEMERKQKFEQNVKDYLGAMDKIQHDLEKIQSNLEQFFEQNNQRIPRGKGQ